MTASGLSVRGLDKTYETDNGMITAFIDVSFDIAPGEFVSILGPSGCGKTTLLHVIAGLEEESGGVVEVGGSRPASRAEVFGYMFQKDLLLPWVRVIDNVALGLVVNGVDRKEAQARSLEVMTKYGLGAFARAYACQLSGGMRQRAALIRTLLVGRPIMLLDEPFGALDALTRSTMQDWLLSVWEGEQGQDRRTVLFVTHDVQEAVFVSDRVLVMSQRPGRIKHVVDIELPRPRLRQELLASPRFGEYCAELLASIVEGAGDAVGQVH